MERYENIIKIEEMRKLADIDQYKKAMKILETIDTGKVKALTDLSIIADVYMQNQRYDEAMEILIRIYGKSKTRRVLYQLVDLSIKRGNAKEAEEYLEKYTKVAPGDASRFIFRYCIDKLNGEPYEVLISTLEQLKEYEYHEMWAYELAKLYHKAGMKDKCVRECSDIVLWFGEGLYVEKAKLLKGYYVGEINPVHMLNAKEKKDAVEKLGLEKTKDYSEMKIQIERYLENENNNSQDGSLQGSEMTNEAVATIEDEALVHNWQDLNEEYKEPVSKMENTAYGYDDAQMYLVSMEQGEDFISTGAIKDTDKEEEPAIDDPELEAFFKKIARKMVEREILGAVNFDQDDNASLDSQEQNENQYDVKETIETIQSAIEPAEESPHTMDEPYEDQEAAAIAEQLWTVNQTEEMNVVESYTEDKDNWNQTYKEPIMEEAYESHTIEEYRPGKLDSIFTEAGMNYEKLFGYLVRMDYTAKQIEECLKIALSDYTKINHLIISGDRKTGKTTLAKKMTKALYGLNRIHADRVAKISALKLNGISLANKKEKLANSSLVIENAGEMNIDTVTQLLSLMEELKEKLYVVLEDTEVGINRLLESNLKLKEVFGCKINLPRYKVGDLVGFAIGYIKDNDYDLTPNTRKTFESEINRILSLTKEGDELEAVMNLAKKTKASADERYKTLLADVIKAREISPEDLLYISEEDFLPEEWINGK